MNPASLRKDNQTRSAGRESQAGGRAGGHRPLSSALRRLFHACASLHGAPRGVVLFLWSFSFCSL